MRLSRTGVRRRETPEYFLKRKGPQRGDHVGVKSSGEPQMEDAAQ